MNARYTASGPVTRTCFIALAVFATLSIGAGIDGMVQHYASVAAAPLAPTWVASAPR
jgi:hypothetical protein